MKQITKYESAYGVLFDTEKECIEYEDLVYEVKIIFHANKQPLNHMREDLAALCEKIGVNKRYCERFRNGDNFIFTVLNDPKEPRFQYLYKKFVDWFIRTGKK